VSTDHDIMCSSEGARGMSISSELTKNVSRRTASRERGSVLVLVTASSP
jgi:hypothetical protein